MPFINRVPQGLLGLLDLKTQGDNPAELAGFVQSVIDLRDFYGLQTRATISQASTLTALGVTAGVFTNLVVPQGECWLVSSLSATLSAPPLGVAATFAMQVGYVTGDTGRFTGLGNYSATIATGADCCSNYDGGILLLPGDSPNVYSLTQTGGNVGVRLTIVRSKFNV